MKPSCTALVSRPRSAACRPQAAIRSAPAALAENHSEVPKSWATTITGRGRMEPPGAGWRVAGGRAGRWPGGGAQPGVIRLPIASPIRIGRAGAQSGLKRRRRLGNSITTVEPSRKRPISSPFLRVTLPGA